MSKCKLAQSLRKLFDSDNEHLKQVVTNHFAASVNYEWYAADCERFIKIIDSDMTVLEFLATKWEPENNGW
jgi:hypothetical protein